MCFDKHIKMDKLYPLKWIKFCNCLYNQNTEMIHHLIKFPYDTFNHASTFFTKVTGKY